MAELGFGSPQQGTALQLGCIHLFVYSWAFVLFIPFFDHQPLLVEDRPAGGWVLSALLGSQSLGMNLSLSEWHCNWYTSLSVPPHVNNQDHLLYWPYLLSLHPGRIDSIMNTKRIALKKKKFSGMRCEGMGNALFKSDFKLVSSEGFNEAWGGCPGYSKTLSSLFFWYCIPKGWIERRLDLLKNVTYKFPFKLRG